MKNYQDFLTINYNKELIPGLFEMELEGEGARFITAPGQFINIKINKNSLQPYLRRPMSILDYDDTYILNLFIVLEVKELRFFQKRNQVKSLMY